MSHYKTKTINGVKVKVKSWKGKKISGRSNKKKTNYTKKYPKSNRGKKKWVALILVKQSTELY